jgi:PAS domain S-box-containing protein
LIATHGVRIARLAVVVGAYFLAGKLGLSLAYVNESTTAVWPPAGIAVAALLMLGTGAWPAVAAGALLVNLTTSGSISASIAIAFGNTLEALAAAWLVERYAHGRAAFERTADIVRFSLLAGGVATAIAASVGTGALLAAGLTSSGEAPAVWLTWWLGDAVGVIVMAPLIMLWTPLRPSSWEAMRLLEAMLLGVAVILVAGVIFGPTRIGGLGLPIQFVALPVLLWAAFRFGPWATAVAAATLASFAAVGTLDGYGPFARPDPNTSLLLLQSFTGVVTLVMLSVAAEVGARRAVEHEMRALNQALEARVAMRTEELTRVRARLIEAQQVAHVGSWEWDVTDNVLWWSDEMCRVYGIDVAPASYEAYLALVHPFDRERSHDAVHSASADGRPFAFDHRIVRPDGTVRTLHAEGRVIIGPDGRAARMVGTGHDITERDAAEAQRAQLLLEQAGRREAEQASRAKDQFLATLSHELRTPLNVALGWAHQLETGVLPAERSASAVRGIRRNLQLLSQLVSDIIDASRITAGAYQLEAGAVDLTAVVHAAIDTVRADADARGISIAVAATPGIVVHGDARRLQQVVWNLLTNAVKFGRPGGSITLTVAADAGAATIVVEDDGPGIPAEFLPHVFEEFRQADASHTREHGGLGLGLSIARHLVELHGGTIAAGNRAGGGAVFTVRLPRDVSVGRSDDWRIA